MPSAAILASISPVAMILAELVAPGAKTAPLLPGAVSPHTYELRPSDLKRAASARVLFWVDEGLDPWAMRLPTTEKIRVLGYLPKGRVLRMEAVGAHHHGVKGVDPHFWTDPLAVESTLGELTKTLCGVAPADCDATKARAMKFGESLRGLDREIGDLLKPFRGKSLFVFHPSFGYFAKRYGLEMTEIVEPSPGKEPSVRSAKGLIERAKAKGVRALFSEPGISRATTRMFADAIGAKVVELDPMGNIDRENYRAYLLGNARKIAEALQ